MRTVKDILLKRKKFHTESDVWDIKFEEIPKFLEKDIPKEFVIIANNGGGDYLLIRKEQLASENAEVFVLWRESKHVEIIIKDLNEHLSSFKRPSQLPGIKYCTGEDVSLGDEVIVEGIFSQKEGKVFYVPGISKKNPEFENGGLVWVGIKFKAGYTATIADPEKFCLKKSIVFKKRKDEEK
jgi:hypothetical protein